MSWKINYTQIIADRQTRLLKLRGNRTLLEAALLHYKHNPIDFINDWCWTQDPKRDLGTIPMILFPRQEEVITWLEERRLNKEDGMIVKSREMGCTWLACDYSVWLWLFWPEQKIGWGSRKEDLVDRKGDPDSIFEKMRFIIRTLPDIFKPTYQNKYGFYVNFDEDKDAPYLKIINKQNGSVIAGEAGDNIGRGGRSSIYFKDESAFYERPEKIEASLSENSDVKIDISTLQDEGNIFDQKRLSGRVPVFTFHWTQDPRKNQAWYDKKKADAVDQIGFAREIDINNVSDAEAIVIPHAWVKAAIDVHTKYPDWVKTGERRGALDVGASLSGDESAFVYGQGSIIEAISKWHEPKVSVTAVKTYRLAMTHSLATIRYDSIGVGADIGGYIDPLQEAKKIKVQYKGVCAGSTKMKGTWENTDIKLVDLLLNVRALMWWHGRRRFEKTFLHVNGIESFPYDELISIPNDPELIAELSRPKQEYSGTKIKIESKEDMKLRGIRSTNKADALLYMLVPTFESTAGGW